MPVLGKFPSIINDTILQLLKADVWNHGYSYVHLSFPFASCSVPSHTAPCRSPKVLDVDDSGPRCHVSTMPHEHVVQ
jgi:hypothetical protein